MAKIILTSQYLKDAPPAQLANYIKYIATREGVEKIDTSKANLSVTKNQQKLIEQLIRDIPSVTELLEYEDYCQKPTVRNATEFITQALEQNLNLIAKRENYVDYIANRPRVERIGEHGLFTDFGTPVILSQVQEEVANHKGIIWTHVISLRREDAARLGYDKGEQWQEFIRSKRAMLLKHMKIDSPNLRWYCAFHNESHHPHVHLMVYSSKSNEGYLSKRAIEAMRSELAHDIFRQDFAHIYQEQNQVRDSVKKESRRIFKELLSQMGSGTYENDVTEEKIRLFSQRLNNTKGKKVYGYLKSDVKNIVDQIVEELAKEEQIVKLYQAWCDCQQEIHNTYSSKTVSFPPLVQQKHFKSIKNMVITEALNIGNHHFMFEDDDFIEPEKEPGDHSIPLLPTEDDIPEQSQKCEKISGSVNWWTKEYKRARAFLYGGEGRLPEFNQAYELFLSEAENGNGLAMHDLGRMYTLGLGREIDTEEAAGWYQKTFQAFHAAERKAPTPYLQYRIGKMYAMGLGTEQDYEQAAEWFWKGVQDDYLYAQYSMAGLYYRGQGMEQDYQLALDLYRRSAEQGNAYADYEAAKMYQVGSGTEKDEVLANEHYQKAFIEFVTMEQKSHDDKLQYRIGQMLYTGTGTEKDINRAAEYLEQAAKVGNVHAQYALAKLYQAGEVVPADIDKAIELYSLSVEQGNEFAAYQLGKLYLSGTKIPKDVEKAVTWLTVSAKQGNQFAQYALGKLYFYVDDVVRDKEASLYWLGLSAAQGNVYAQSLIHHINDSTSVLLSATRLMHRLEQLFMEEYKRMAGGGSLQIDRKRRRKLQEKKVALGHARDEHSQPEQLL